MRQDGRRPGLLVINVTHLANRYGGARGGQGIEPCTGWESTG
jgi:hypothetical protein